MRIKSKAAALASVLATGVGGAYLIGEAANPQLASAQSPVTRTRPADGSMMGAGAGSMTSLMSGQGSGMMGDRAMRRLCREMLRDPAIRRELHRFAGMATMMRSSNA